MNLKTVLTNVISFFDSVFKNKKINENEIEKTKNKIISLAKILIGEGNYVMSAINKRDDNTLFFNVCNQDNGRICKCLIYSDGSFSLGEIPVDDIEF